MHGRVSSPAVQAPLGWLTVGSLPDNGARFPGRPAVKVRGWLLVGDEVGDPFRLVDLDVVPSAV